MKQVKFLLIVIVMAMIQLPAICKPKKLMYGDNIQYYGEVDKNKQPLGRGQLQNIGYAGYALDIITGDFEGVKVTNAEVLFGISNWPNDPRDPQKRTAKYTGTMEFDIKEANGRTYLVYKLKDGILEIAKSRDRRGYSYDELSISCKPQDDYIIERYASPQSSRGIDTKFHGNFHHEKGDVDCIYNFFDEDNLGYFHYSKEEKMSKAKEERLRAEYEKKLKTPSGLAERIISMIDDKNQPFSEVASMADKLLAAGFDPARPTLFTILGVTYYLTLEAFEKTIELMDILSSGQSAIILDYPDKMRLDAHTPERVLQLARMTQQLGESMSEGFSFEEMRAVFARHHFDIQKHLSPKEIQLYYFSNRKDGLTAFDNIHFLYAQKIGDAGSGVLSA